jgi:hypothetical protein
MNDNIIMMLSMIGMDPSIIKENAPELAEGIDDNYNIGMSIGKVLALAQAMATRRHLDNLLTMGFTREEAVAIIAGGGMSKAS